MIQTKTNIKDLIETVRIFNKEFNIRVNTKKVHYRELNPEITTDDFHICTSVDFKRVPILEFDGDNNVYQTWETIKNSGDVSYSFISKWKSHYMCIDGMMYRMANHWGGVKTCRWTLEGGGELRPHIFDTSMDWEIGVAPIKDFKVFRRKEARKEDFKLNPLWVSFIESHQPFKYI